MTAPTMNGLIHDAVRRDLARLSATLDPWQDGDRDRGRLLERAFADLHRELTHHHEGEDAHVWPFLEGTGADRDVLAEMEAEHEAMSAALSATDLAALARTGAGSATATARCCGPPCRRRSPACWSACSAAATPATSPRSGATPSAGS